VNLTEEVRNSKTPLQMRFKCKGSLWNAWPSYAERNRYIINKY